MLDPGDLGYPHSEVEAEASVATFTEPRHFSPRWGLPGGHPKWTTWTSPDGVVRLKLCLRFLKPASRSMGSALATISAMKMAPSEAMGS